MTATLSPSTLGGRIAAIPSKSDAHRVLICAALADRPTTFALPVRSADIDATIACLRALGADITLADGRCTVVPLTTPTASPLLDCGECGTTLRFLLPVAAALGGNATFAGHGRLPARPIGELLDVLAQHGVTASSPTLPLTLSGHMTAGSFTLPGNVSSQYISGLLLAMPWLHEPARIRLTTNIESTGYIDMTRRTMVRFGVTIADEADGFSFDGATGYRAPESLTVEGDWSNAAFWLAAGALGSTVTMTGLFAESAQGDKAILPLLRRFGAKVAQHGDTVTVSAAPLRGIDIDMRDIPDLLPPLAVVAAAAQGTTRLYNAARVRLKECDRLSAMTALLTTLGTRVEEREDELLIHGGTPLTGGDVDGCNDHRIVMAAALAASLAQAPVTVSDSEAVAKSYPAFFADYQQLGGIAHGFPIR